MTFSFRNSTAGESPWKIVFRQHLVPVVCVALVFVIPLYFELEIVKKQTSKLVEYSNGTSAMVRERALRM